jgi:glycosyltransferase involved in cell wall biosynthesis
MNVLHINEQRGWRGGEQQASYLIRGLAQRGHNVFIAGRPGCPFIQSDHGVDGIVKIGAPFFSEFDVYTAAVIARAVRRHAVDILHAHTSHAHTVACIARAIAGRGKVVVSRRVDFAPRNNPFNRWKYSLPDAFVAVSSCIARVMREFGIRESRLTVVHSGTDASRFNVDPIPRAQLGVADGAPLLGCVAALVGHKDHAILIDAAPFMLRRLPQLRLLLIGEGRLRPRIEAQIASLNLGQSVTLLGHRPDVPRILRALDAFVLSSKEEGFGGAALEAMACGLPVVSTDAGGMSETVVHEKTGLLVPVGDSQALADAVVRVFTEPLLVERLRANLPDQVDHFSIDRMIEGNLALYHRLLDRESKSR